MQPGDIQESKEITGEIIDEANRNIVTWNMASTLPKFVSKTCRITSADLEVNDILSVLAEKYPERKIISRKLDEIALEISSTDIVVSGDEEYDNLVDQLKRKEEELE